MIINWTIYQVIRLSSRRQGHQNCKKRWPSDNSVFSNNSNSSYHPCTWCDTTKDVLNKNGSTNATLQTEWSYSGTLFKSQSENERESEKKEAKVLGM